MAHYNYHLNADGAAGLALAELLDRLGWQDAACDLQSNIVGDHAGKTLHPDDIRADADAMKDWGEQRLFTTIAEGLAHSRIEDAKRAEKQARANATVAGWVAAGWTGKAE
jgi:hypothetical protein